jgi:serine protease AprX
MKRFSAIFAIFVLAGAATAQAQFHSQAKPGKFDYKLTKKLLTGKGSDTVSVIIQTHDLKSLQSKFSNFKAKNTKGFSSFSGLAGELTLSQLATLAQDSTIDAISSDEPIHTNNAVDGTEAPNSSSGALAALNRYGLAGDGIGVAIIDSGIASVQGLQNVVYRMDFTDSLKKGDPYGHGTHVAGIVGNSGEGPSKNYAGVAPNARLIDLRVLDETGTGATSDVISAIDWVIANRNATGYDGKPVNIRVINLSLGHPPMEGADTDPLSVECRKAVQAGIVVVAAAGNYGKDASGNTVYGTILTPGIEPSVITVGAVTTWGTPSRADDVVASYSSRGPTVDNIIKPDIVAPGSRIVSTLSPGSQIITQNPTLQIDANYMMLSGTSMAAPEVAGSVAMILSRDPWLTPNAVKGMLMYTAEKRGNPLDWGAGYLNVLGAMELASAVNPWANVGSYWVRSPFLLPSFDLINGSPVTWGQTIIWGDSLYSGNSLNFNKSAWSQTVVWGDTIVWTDTICWGETIVWDTNALAAETIVFGETIVWDSVAANTIIWGDSFDEVDAQ